VQVAGACVAVAGAVDATPLERIGDAGMVVLSDVAAAVYVEVGADDEGELDDVRDGVGAGVVGQIKVGVGGGVGGKVVC